MKHIQSQITDTMGVLLSPAAEPHPLGRGYGQDSSGPQRLPRSWILFWLCQAFAAGWLARPPETFGIQGIHGRFQEGRECQGFRGTSTSWSSFREPSSGHFAAFTRSRFFQVYSPTLPLFAMV